MLTTAVAKLRVPSTVKVMKLQETRTVTSTEVRYNTTCIWQLNAGQLEVYDMVIGRLDSTSEATTVMVPVRDQRRDSREVPVRLGTAAFLESRRRSLHSQMVSVRQPFSPAYPLVKVP